MWTMDARVTTYLDDFLAGEHTPGDGVGTLGVGVGAEITLLIHSVVGNARVAFDTPDELVEKCRSNKELEVGLNVNSSQ
jgi:hypothetical protein